MKKPLAIIWNDVHLKTGNEYEVLQSVKHMIEYACENGIDNLIFAGDLFHSRQFQRQEVLKTFDYILTILKSSDLKCYLFPGNHDKTDYGSEYSFLDIYRHHPSVEFNSKLEVIELEGVTITLLPFFSDDKLVPMIEEAEPTDVLISHFEMQGSTNLGRVSEKKNITRKMLKKFKKTYLGHYHNTHEITKDIIHLPSLRQNDFGEDDNKGFTVLYDDLSYKIIEGKFRKFKKQIINIDEVTTKDIKALIKQFSGSKDAIRFEFIGSESNLKALDKAMFKGTGIDVKTKFEAKWEFDSDVEPTVIEEYTADSVREIFKSFCEEKDFDYEVGKEYLEEFLTQETV